MKRTATTLALLAGFGGGCMSTDGPNAKQAKGPGGFGTVTVPATANGVQGPNGEPIPLVARTTARGAMPNSSGTPSTVVSATGYRPAGKYNTVIRGYVPGISTVDSRVMQANGNEPPYGPPQGGILPVPGMGPPGAVAAVGSMNPNMRSAPSNQRTSIRFTSPAGMKITWQLPNGSFNEKGLTAPVDYNFLQSQVYRLRLKDILPNFPGRTFYPTLEISPVTPKTMTYLAHASVPVTFADEDFRQAADGNLVVKVIYLPDPAFQDFAALGGADEIVSTRLEPGADPIAEAQKRGTILAVIRLGNVDLENNYSPSMTAPPPGMGMPPVMMPPSGPRPMPPMIGPGGGAKISTPEPLPPSLKPTDDSKLINLPPIK